MRDADAGALRRARVGILGWILAGGTILMLLALAAPARAGGPGAGDGDEADAAVADGLVLTSAARELPLIYRKKSTAGAAVEAKLSPQVRIALNDWADTVGRLELTVVVPAEASALVIGRAPKKTLVEAASTLDDTWELIEPLREAADGEPEMVVAVLLDREALESDLWGKLLEYLGERRLLSGSAVRNLERSRGGVTVRERGLFVQPTYDLAGNAAAGDDEFRLGNEVAHKFAVCWLRMRFGEVPTTVRWGFGYVMEQRLFHSIYQFDTTGFVATADHFDWPKRTVEALDKIRKSKTLQISGTVMQQGHAGGVNSAQMVSWGAVDYLLQKDPEQLASLFTGFGELHAEAAGRRSLPTFAGDGDRARELLDGALAGVDARKLQKHIKRVK